MPAWHGIWILDKSARTAQDGAGHSDSVSVPPVGRRTLAHLGCVSLSDCQPSSHCRFDRIVSAPIRRLFWRRTVYRFIVMTLGQPGLSHPKQFLWRFCLENAACRSAVEIPSIRLYLLCSSNRRRTNSHGRSWWAESWNDGSIAGTWCFCQASI